VVQYASNYNNDVSYVITSFLFNMAGKTLTIKNIFETIINDIGNQSYYDVAFQYGRMFKTLFVFDAYIEPTTYLMATNTNT
jgi:hypothetical protein